VATHDPISKKAAVPQDSWLLRRLREIEASLDPAANLLLRNQFDVAIGVGKDSPVNGTSSTVFRPMSDS
jgi:hypothetical protein